jgi:hypothetical protein
MKLITGAVALTTALTFALAPAAAADAPDGKGVPHSTETQSTGKPINPANGFGSVTSQLALNEHNIGSHVSSQSRPHQGVGNVSRNDQAEFDAANTDNDGTPIENKGTRPGDHAMAIGPLLGYDPNDRPGTREVEETTTATSIDTSAPAALATPAADDRNDRPGTLEGEERAIAPSIDTSVPAALAAPGADDPNDRAGTLEGEERAIAPSIDTSVPAALAAPAADAPSFSLGPLGTFSYSFNGFSLTDYSYLFGLSGGPVEFSVQSQGTDAGLTSSLSASAGGFSTSLDSAYGTSYEGSSCVLCQENTTSFGDLVQFTEFNVLADGTVELEQSGPFGSFSWPPE